MTAATGPGMDQASAVIVERTASALSRHLSGASAVERGRADVPGLWHETGQRPALRVEAAHSADVAVAVRVAAEQGLPLAVWGGRRDTQARNAGVGGVVLDLRRLRHGRFDPAASTLTVGGGTTVRDLLDVLPLDKVAVTTSNADIGIVGAGVGGGYGPLLPRYGMVADQLVAARLVLADGTETDADGELMWALRGGGSGFGVVTEATFATHRLESVLHAVVTVPVSGAERGLQVVQELLDRDPDGLSVLPLFVAGPDGPLLHLVAHRTAATAGDDAVLRALGRLPGAAVALAHRVPYARSFSPDDDVLFPAGRRWSSATCTIGRLHADAARVLVEGARTMPPGAVLFLHDFHGAATRVAAEATAFPLRRPHFVVTAVVPTDVGDETTALHHQRWADDVTTALAPGVLPGGYVNFLRPSATDRVADFYGTALSRLAAIKDRVDPDHRFTAVTGSGSLAKRSAR